MGDAHRKLPGADAAIFESFDFAAALANGPVILAGDFNHNVGLDKAGARRKFAQAVAKLAELGLQSAWHTFRGEAHGRESAATLYFLRKQERPFHIDYAFLSSTLAVAKAELGSYDAWVTSRLSDHVPLLIEFSLPN